MMIEFVATATVLVWLFAAMLLIAWAWHADNLFDQKVVRRFFGGCVAIGLTGLPAWGFYWDMNKTHPSLEDLEFFFLWGSFAAAVLGGLNIARELHEWKRSQSQSEHRPKEQLGPSLVRSGKFWLGLVSFVASILGIIGFYLSYLR